MAHTTKIATCCYCGARTALVVDKHRHELACASCGAPLHYMKSLPKKKDEKNRDKPHGPHRHKGQRHEHPDWHYATSRPKKRKKRKTLLRKFIEEAVDIIEDIID